MVIVAAILVGGIVFANRILAGDAFSKEEAQHALYSFWLWKDMRALDWGNFWYDTNRQMFWPFFHSWLLSGFFLVFGVSYISARSLSLLFFLASVVYIYLISDKLSEKNGWKIGVLAALLALFSPMMIDYSSLNMLESLGALLFLVSTYLYIVAEDRKDLLHYGFLAFTIGLTVYTNYLYAFLLIPAFLVATLTDLGPIFAGAIKLRRAGEPAAINFVWWAYRKLIVLAILLVLAGVWFSFSFSRKILLLFDAIFRYSNGAISADAWHTVLYYPQVIVQNIAISPWLGFLMLVALAVPFIALKYHGLNKLYVFVWTVLVIATFIVPTKSPVVIYTILPFIYIIFSAALFYFSAMLDKGKWKLASTFMLLLFLPAFFSLPRAYMLLFPDTGRGNMVQVMEYFDQAVPRGKNVTLPINIRQLNSEGVMFHFRDRGEGVDVDLPVSDTALEGEDRYFLTMEIDTDSRYNKSITDDSIYRWNSWLWAKEMNGEVRLYSSKRFEAIGVTAKIYQPVQSQP